MSRYQIIHTDNISGRKSCIYTGEDIQYAKSVLYDIAIHQVAAHGHIYRGSKIIRKGQEDWVFLPKPQFVGYDEIPRTPSAGLKKFTMGSLCWEIVEIPE